METIRQQIVRLLAQQAMTAVELSQAVGIPEKDVYRHLGHVQKSAAAQGQRLSTIPSRCLACGFTFTQRRRFTRPGRCPRCRRSRIDYPSFRIEKAGIKGSKANKSESTDDHRTAAIGSSRPAG